jgi:transposase
MKVEYSCCAGLDVHKRLVVACVLKGEPGQEPVSETKSFGTTTCELMEMVEWLKSHGITHAAMEATGNFWMPVYNLLEGHFELIVTNAAHMKAVPGRKSDVQDAAWIAELLRHGLLKASLVPSRQQRDLRELTRHRSSLAGKRAQAANELQKALESANIKLQSVVSDITGVSSTEMLEELVAGKSDPKELAQLAKRRLRAKIPQLEKALSGNLRAHHKLIIEQLLTDIGVFVAQIAELDAYIETLLRKEDDNINRLDGTPGINRRVAEIIIAEAGIDMNRFPNEHHFASWIGLSPDRTRAWASAKALKLAKAIAPYAPHLWKPPMAPYERKKATSAPNTGVSPQGAARRRPSLPSPTLWQSPSIICSNPRTPTASSAPTSSIRSIPSKSFSALPNASSALATLSK